VPVTLHKGANQIRLTGDVRLDYVDVARFSRRFEAEDGQATGASRIDVDMSEGNFFAAAFSQDAYLRGLGSVKLPVTVPAAGVYRLRIGYSTAGTEEERRAQTKAFHQLRVDGGPWQQVEYDPTQFREMLRQAYTTVRLPAGTSTLELTKDGLPGTVDLDWIDVQTPPG